MYSNRSFEADKTPEIREYAEELFDHFKDEDGKLDEGYVFDDEVDVSELHHQMFNTDYYIIGYNRATDWLGSDAFEAIGLVVDYESDHYGEVHTDLTDPERVVNMVAYIIGEQVLVDIVDSYLSEIGDDSNE